MSDLNPGFEEQLNAVWPESKSPDIQTIATTITRWFFLYGDHGYTCQRIAFMGGKYPDNEKMLGGLSELAMAHWLARAMTMAIAESEGSEEWIDQIDAPLLTDKKAFQDLTTISARLLVGGRLDDLYAICEGQSSVSTNKLQGLVDELRERDRKLAVQLIALRDLGGDA